jgi:hypothetical protein
MVCPEHFNASHKILCVKSSKTTCVIDWMYSSIDLTRLGPLNSVYSRWYLVRLRTNMMECQVDPANVSDAMENAADGQF